MPEEFQPYMYLSHDDIKSPQPGKVVGILLVFASGIMFVMKIFGSKMSWGVVLLVFGIGMGSIYLGKIIRAQKEKPKKEKPVLVHSD